MNDPRTQSQHFKKAEEEILRSNLELERFAYIASHDLQEPLRMISNFTKLLQAEYGDMFDDQAENYMNYIVESSLRLQSMIDDILDYSRLDQEEIGFETVDCHDCLQQALQNLSASIEQTKAIITYDPLPNEIITIPMRLIRIFQNIISNAIKYRHKQHSPKIHISVEEKANEVIFSISDNGIGIDPQYADDIFILFKRLHNKNEYSGTGIGLSVCQKIVESLHGRIWVTPNTDQGSVFHFTIPNHH